MNSQIEPSKELLEKILKRIHHEERILVLRRVILFSITLIASAVGFIPAFKMLSADLAQSGFFNFFSLIFSDFSAVASYWKNFTLILLETLPAIAIVLFLALVLVFLQSLRLLAKNIKIIRRFAIN
jgi:hypothetical protein